MRNYVFRRQIGNRGCYAEIKFDVSIKKETSDDLIVIYLADARWETACRAGISIFKEYFERKMSGSLEVTIFEIKWLPIDTNNLLILFASIEALNEALGLKVEKLQFDVANEIFLFPEIRSSL
jgi:hypothetical protein